MRRFTHLSLALGTVALLAFLLFLAVGAQPTALADGNTIKVPDDHTTIQAAIDAATDGDTILILGGPPLTPTIYSENLNITKGITLSGGWNDDFTVRQPRTSVIDAQGLGRAISITCPTSDTVVTIDGFVITNGDATGLTAPVIPALPGPGSRPYHYSDRVLPAHGRDGTTDYVATEAQVLPPPTEQMAELRALLADLESRGLYPGGAAAYQAMLDRLELRTEQAEAAQTRAEVLPAPLVSQAQQEVGQGGGIYSWKASPHLLNNSIQDNVATRSGTGWGGGVYVSYAAPSGVLIANNSISVNEASNQGQGLGGGLLLFVAPGAVVTGNSIYDNTASDHGDGWGGGVHLDGSPDVIFEDNLIVENVGTSYGSGKGGGLYITESPGVNITDSDFQTNVASSYGEGDGGGLYVLGSPGVIVEGNSILENVGLDGGLPGGGAGAGGGLMVDTSTDVMIRDNLVEGNTGNAHWDAGGGLGGGILLWIANGAIVTDNVIRANLGVLNGTGGSGGILVAWTQKALVADNEVSGNWGMMFAPLAAGSAGGGGIGLDHVFGSTVSGNEIRENTGIVYKGTDCFGGGIFVTKISEGLQLTGNDIIANVACLDNDGGLSGGGGGYIGDSEDVVVSGNTIADNIAGIRPGAAGGGGLFIRNTVGSQILSNRFVDNKAGTGDFARGGGLLMDSFPWGSRLATVDGNLFLDNQASTEPSAQNTVGGACSVARWQDEYLFTNNVLAGNQASDGGGLNLLDIRGATLINNTLVGNGEIGVVVDSDIPDLTLTNNIIVSHTVGISVTEGATATVSYMLWDGNDTDIGGGGTINHTHPVYGNPAFVDPPSHDYHLAVGSLAIDAGDPAGVPPAPDHDRDGVTRPQGVAVDIGAYEWQGHYQYLPLVTDQRQPVVGWAAGHSVDGYGVIIHTTDGGGTWERQGTAGEIPDANLAGVAAIDAQNAWVVGAQGTILRTHNGGLTWQQQEVPAEVSDAELCGIYAVDRNTAWIGGAAVTPSETGFILHTTDGGHTWSRQGQDLVLTANLCGVYASDGDHAWVVGQVEPPLEYATILQTADAGETWERMPYTPTKPNIGGHLISIHGHDSSPLWAVGNAQALYSADGGVTWIDDRSPSVGFFDINGVHVVDHNSVWIVVDDGGIYRSDDSGANWVKQSVPPGTTGDYILRISAVDGQTAWAVTSPDPRHPSFPGHVLHTRDGGQTWIAQTIPVSPAFWGVSFVGARR